MKTLKIAVGVFAFFILTIFAQAQQVDAAIGLGTVSSASTNFSNVFTNFKQSLRGGTFMSFSGDAFIKGNLGVEGEVAWRTSKTLYAGALPYRPLFWDFNAIYAPRFSKFFGVEALAGIGAESARFYTGLNCSGFTGCTNYTSRSHFMGDFGGGLRLYPFGNFFVRPEARLYLINNNTEFSSGKAVRYGISIGYTFGGKYY